MAWVVTYCAFRWPVKANKAITKMIVLPQDRNVGGGYGKWIDEQKYTLIVKGETFPERRKKL